MADPRGPSRAELEARIRTQAAELARLRSAPNRTLVESLLDAAPLPIFLKDAELNYLFCNAAFERLGGLDRDRVHGRHDFELFPRPIAELFRAQDEEVRRRRESVEFRETLALPDGVHSFITVEFPLLDEAGELLGIAGVCTDVTRDVTTAEERERLVEELRAANEKLDVLEGILPICAYCKQIRAEDGTWERVEGYVGKRTRARFSHTYCPTCLETHYPGTDPGAAPD